MISLVTVVFSGDMDLLRYQAKSLALCVNPERFSDINIIINDVNETAIRDQLQDILPLYGPHAPKVRIFGGDDVLLRTPRKQRLSLFEWLYVERRHQLPFLSAEGWRGGAGYRMQQALKLASARIAKCDRVLILDGKNIFLRDFDVAEHFDEKDRGLATFRPPTPDFHRGWLNESLAALGVNQTADDFSLTTGYETPYPVNRQLMLRVLDEIAERHGSVQALFASKRRPTEFMLLFASCIRNEGSTDRFFGKYKAEPLGIWKEHPPELIDKTLTQAEATPSPAFGVHRKAIGLLNKEQRRRLVLIFEDRGLDIMPLFEGS